MTCPIDARLAAAASGEDAGAAAHAVECLRCRVLLAEQREVIATARRWSPPALRADHRAALAAEVMARSDFGPSRWRDARTLVAAGLVAAAAAALLVASDPPNPSVPASPELASSDELPIEIVERASVENVPGPRPLQRAEISASDADFSRARRDRLDIVTLRDGEVTIDARDREPVTIVGGDTHVVIASSRVKVVAREGVIVTARVFAGTAEITSAGKRRVIDAGTLWTREAAPAPADLGPGASLAAFRAGWEALRLERYADATEAFDRATDPVVAEDAAFWAAIASERAGNREDATRRLHAFLARFPTSVRVDAAHGALDRVTR